MEKFPLTKQGYIELEAELKRLKSEDRPNIIAAIAEARSHGDLSENAEYSAAKEKQSFIEGRIQELEAVISRAQVIDPHKTKAASFVLALRLLWLMRPLMKKNNTKLLAITRLILKRTKSHCHHHWPKPSLVKRPEILLNIWPPAAKNLLKY